jgi:hypothetical protein
VRTHAPWLVCQIQFPVGSPFDSGSGHSVLQLGCITFFSGSFISVPSLQSTTYTCLAPLGAGMRTLRPPLPSEIGMRNQNQMTGAKSACVRVGCETSGDSRTRTLRIIHPCTAQSRANLRILYIYLYFALIMKCAAIL